MITFTMLSKEAIFIFTKDRPETFRKTLWSLQSVPNNIYIVDDSTLVLNRQMVFDISKDYPNGIYLGINEYNQFIVQNKIDPTKFDFLLKPLGSIGWNLGYARNFALLYSKALDLEKVLFSDDDIEVPNLNLIEELFEAIKNNQFVGANILGLVDDSVLGHIATDLGIVNERMLSGGFMAFNPGKIDHFFLNNYNEDWIWLFLQLKEKKYLQFGEVFQELTDPLANYKTKVMFQEFGEIALDGILDLYEQGSYDELIQLSFWERMVNERENYLGILLSQSVSEDKRKYSEIIEHIKFNSQRLTAVLFKNLFEKYFIDNILFRRLYSSL